ncbi:MAG TPA: anthranilate phosphoribosyltransferase [Candidatus Nanopelagicales bacterium]|nr:anthranilate phosphoribosyltransferase [Candidatus Nanopelagicales bacterium]
MSTPATSAAEDPSSRDWPDLIAALLRREDLGADDTSWAMGRVMEGDATPAQLAGFLVALRAKGETHDEVAGLVSAMLDRAATVEVDPALGPTVDTCGTGGDRSHTVNISTMAAVVVAAAGAPVVKHGGRAASSAAGSADVLEALGVAVDLAPAVAGECLSEAGIVFCFAPVFHPGMRHAAVARRELGVGTVFNVLGPLANPARPAAQVVGCADLRLAPVMAATLQGRGTRALVVRGTDGLDELSTLAPTTVWDATSGSVQESVMDALDLGIARPAEGALRGQDAAYNAGVARAVLSGERSAVLDPVRDAVLLGAAAALVAHDAALGAEPTGSVGDRLAAALPRAAAAIDDGAAGALLDRWVEVSQRLAAR